MTRNAKVSHVSCRIQTNLRCLKEGDKEALDILRTVMPFVNAVFLAQSTQPNLSSGEVFRKEFRFWPEGITRDKVSNFPNPRALVKTSGDGFEEVSYSDEYREKLVEVSKLLRLAANKAESPSFSTFLRSRADSFESNNYQKSEIDWLHVEGSMIELIIGFYEDYGDRFGIKTTMEAVLGIIAPEEHLKLQEFCGRANMFDAWLGEYFNFKPKPVFCPMVALDVVETAGGSLYESIPMACCLPNDEEIRKKFGSKKSFFVNVMRAKFGIITTEIAKHVLLERLQPLFSFQGFFEGTIGHEIAHGLSFHFGSKFQEVSNGLEELKADVFGLWFIYWLEDEGFLPQGSGDVAVVTNLVDKLRQIRFGIESAHAQGALVQMQFAERSKLISFVAGRLEIKEAHLREYVEKICFHTYQAFCGGYSAGVDLINEFGVVTEELQSLVSSLSDVPVDIDPHYT